MKTAGLPQQVDVFVRDILEKSVPDSVDELCRPRSGSGSAMIQLECPASPFPAPDVVLSSSAQASRAFSDVRMFFFIFSMVRV
jgi:hypothetical protein